MLSCYYIKKKKKRAPLQHSRCTAIVCKACSHYLHLSPLNPAHSSCLLFLRGHWLVRLYSDRLKRIQMGAFQSGSARGSSWNLSTPATQRSILLVTLMSHTDNLVKWMKSGGITARFLSSANLECNFHGQPSDSCCGIPVRIGLSIRYNS